ncbi:hypothetical protein HanRHA438_Chr02g0057551 [Helianthus annuus]|nr:hypothetical protein HanRHA438_Chr02g0057551 [Helianthus annuus]
MEGVRVPIGLNPGGKIVAYSYIYFIRYSKVFGLSPFEISITNYIHFKEVFAFQSVLK